MKIDLKLEIFALLITSILTYLVYSSANDEVNTILLCVLSFIGLGSTLSIGIALKAESLGSTTNIKVLSIVTALILLILNIIFAIVGAGNNTMIITDSLIIAILLLLVFVFPKNT